MDSSSQTPDRGARWGLAAAISAAVAASACCTVPLLLVSLGVGGAWVGSLTAFEPYRPFFVALAVGALGYVAWREWRAARLAASGSDASGSGVDCDCEGDAVRPRTRRAVLGVGALAAVLLLASPWLVRAASGPPATPAVLAGGAPLDGRVPLAAARVVLAVEGMTCASCTVTVRRALLNVDGVEAADVSFAPPRAVVSFDPTRATVADLMAATAAAGYPTTPATDA
jgi:mercuric transport protein